MIRRATSFAVPKQENDGLEGDQVSGQIRRNGNFQAQGQNMPRASPHWNAVQKELNKLSSVTEDGTPENMYDVYSRSPLKREQAKPVMTASSRPLLKRAQEKPVNMTSLEKPVPPKPYWASVQESISRGEIKKSFPAEQDQIDHSMMQIPQEDHFVMAQEDGRLRQAPYWDVNSALVQSEFGGEVDPFLETMMDTAEEPQEERSSYLSPVDQNMDSAFEGSNFPKTILDAYWVNTDDTNKIRNGHYKKSESSSNASAKIAEVSPLDKKITKMAKSKKCNPFKKEVLGQIPISSSKGEMVKPSSDNQEPSADFFKQTGPSKELKNEMEKLSSLKKRDPFNKAVLGKDSLVDSGSEVEIPQPPSPSKRTASPKKVKGKDITDGSTIKMWTPQPPKNEAEKPSGSNNGNPFERKVRGKDPAEDLSDEMKKLSSLNKRKPFSRPVLGQSSPARSSIIKQEEPQEKLCSADEPQKDIYSKKEVTKLNNKIKEYEKWLQSLKEELETVKFEKEEYLRCITQLNNQSQRDTQLIDHLGYDNASLKRQVKEMEYDLGILVKADEELHFQVKALENVQCENQKLTQEMMRLSGVLEKQKKENVTLNEEIKMITDVQAQTAMKNENLMLTEKMLMASIKELEDDMKDLKAEKESDLKEIESLKIIKSKEEKTREENVMLKTKLNELEIDLKKKEESEFKPSDSIMEALKRNEELKRRIAEIDKEKAEIKANNDKCTSRIEKLAVIDQRTKDDIGSDNTKTKLTEVKAALTFVNRENSLETSTGKLKAQKQDVDLQARNEELKSKVKELEKMLRQSQSASKEFKSGKKVSDGPKTKDNASKNMITIEEVMKQLKTLHNIILDAKKELNDDHDTSSFNESVASSFTNSFAEAEKYRKAQRPEVERLFKTLTNAAEDLLGEITNKRKKSNKFHSDDATQDEISNLKDQVMHLEDDIKDLENDLNGAKDQYRNLEKSFDKKKQLNEKLQRELDDIKNKLQTSVAASNSELGQLKDELKSKDLKIKELQNELQSFKNKENDSKELFKTSFSEDAAKNLKVTDLQGYIKKLETEKLKLLDSVEEHKHKSITVNQSKDNELRIEIKKLKGEMKDLQAEKNKLEEQLKKVNSNCKDLEAELDNIRKEKNADMLKMVDQVTVLQDEIKDRERMLAQAKEDASNDNKKYESDVEEELKKSNIKCKEREAELDNIRKEKNTEMQRIGDQITVLQDEIKEKELILAKVREDASNDKKKYENETNLLRKEIQFLQDVAAGNKKNLEDNDYNLAATKTTGANGLEQLSKDMLHKIEMYDALSVQIRNDNAMHLDHNNDIALSLGAQIENTIIFLENSNAQLRNKLSHSERQLKKMMENRDSPDNDAKAENENVAEQNEPYTMPGKDIYKTSQELERLKVSSRKLEESLEKTSTELKNVMVERSTLQKELQDLKLKQFQLEMEMQHAVMVETSLKERNVMLKDEVESLEKELSDRESELNILKKSKEIHPTVDFKNDSGSLERKVIDLTKDNEMMSAKEKQLQLYNKQLESVVISSQETVNELKQKVTMLEVAQRTWEEKENTFRNETQASSAKIKNLESKLSENMKDVESWHEREKGEAVAQEISVNSPMDASKMFELSEQLEDAQNKLKVNEELMQELQQQITLLTTQRNNSMKQLKQKSIQIAKLESTLQDKTKVEKKLSDTVQSLEKGGIEMREQLENLKAENLLLTKQLETVEKQPDNETTDSLVNIVELQQMVGDVLNEKAVMYTQEQQLKEEIKKLGLKDCTEESERRLKSLEEQLFESKETLEKSFKSSQNQLKELQEASEKAVKYLEDQKEKMSAQIQELESQAKISKGHLDLLKRKLSRLETDKIKWEQKEIRLEREGFSLLEKIDDLQIKLAKTTDMKDDDKEQISLEVTASFKAKLSEVMDDKEMLREQVERLNVQMQKYEGDTEKVDDLERKISSQQGKNVMWEQKEVRLEKAAFALNKKIDSLQEKLEEQNSALEEKEKQLIVFKELNSQLQEGMNKVVTEKELLAKQFAGVQSSLQSRIKELKQTISEHVASNKLLFESQVQMENTINKLQKKVQSLTVENEQLALNEKSLDKDTSAKALEIKASLDKHSDAEMEWKKQEKELEEKLRHLQECVQIYEKKTAALETTIKELEACISEDKRPKESWCQAESNLKEKILKLEESIITLTEKNEQLVKKHDKQNDDKIGKLQTTRQDVSKLERKIGLLQGQVESLMSENNKLSEKIKEQQEAYNKRVLEMENEVAQPQSTNKDVSKFENEIALLQERVASLTSYNDELNAKIKETKDTSKKKELEVEDQVRLSDNTSNVAELEKMIALLQEKVDSLTSANDELKEKIKEQQEVYVEVKDKTEKPQPRILVLELEKKMALLQERVQHLTTDNDRLNAMIKDQQETYEKKEPDVKDKDGNASEVLGLEIKVGFLQGKVESLTSDNDRLNVKIKQQQKVYKKKLHALEAKLSKQKSSSERSPGLTKSESTTSCKEELFELKERLKESKDSEKKLNNALDHMKVKMSELNDTKNRKTSDVSKLESKMSLLQGQVNSLMYEKDKLHAKFKDQNEAYGKKVQVEEKVGQSQNASNVLKLECKIALLQEQVDCLTSDKEKLIKEHQQVYEKKLVEEKDKDGQYHGTSNVPELEKKITLLQERVDSLTADNDKLILKIKQQQEAYEKKDVEMKYQGQQPHGTSNVPEPEKKIALLQERVDFSTADNDKLNLKIKEQQGAYEKRVWEMKDKVEQSQAGISSVAEFEKKIGLLQDRVDSLTSDNEKLNFKIKQQQEAFEFRVLGVRDKEEQPENASNVTEKKITLLQEQVNSLTTDNKKLHLMIKEKQNVYKKKLRALETNFAKQESSSERSHGLSKEEDGSSQKSESITSYKSELFDLKESLKETKDSEKKLNNTLEHMKVKMRELNDAKDKLQRENDYLMNKMRDQKYEMEKYIELDQEIQYKIENMTEEISTMKSEKRQIYQEISYMIKELQAKEDDEKQLSLGDEINLAFRQAIASIEEDDDDDAFWGIDVKSISEEDKELQNLEFQEVDTPLPNLHSSLQQLKSTIEAALQKPHNNSQTTWDEEPRKYKIVKELNEKITRIEEENDYLQRQVQELNTELQKTKKEAENIEKHSLATEDEAETIVKSLNEKVIQVQEEKRSLEEKVEELTASKYKLENAMEGRTAELKQLKDKITSLELKSQDQSKSFERNEMVYNESMNKMNEEVRRLQKDLKSKVSVTEELKDVVDRLENDLEIKEKRITEYNKANNELKEQIKNAQENVSVLEESKSKLQYTLDEMMIDKESTEKIIREKLENEEQERNDVLASKEKLQRTVDELLEKLEKLEREKTEMLNDEKARSKEFEERLNNVMQGPDESSSDEIKDLKALMFRLSVELERKTRANKELNENLINLQKTIDLLREKTQPRTGESNHLRITTYPTLRQSGINLNELRLKQDILRINIEDMRRDVDRLGAHQKDLDDDTRDQIRLLKYKVSTAHDKVFDLLRHIKYRAQKERKFIEELAIVKRDRDNMAEKVRRSELEISKSMMEINTSKSKIDDLQQQLNARNSDVMRMCQNMVFSSMRSGPTSFRHEDDDETAGVSHNADFMARQRGHNGLIY